MFRSALLLGLLGVYFLSSKVLGEHHTLKTPEGYFARALLYAPVLVIVVRSLYLYSPDAILSLTAFGADLFYAAYNRRSVCVKHQRRRYSQLA